MNNNASQAVRDPSAVPPGIGSMTVGTFTAVAFLNESRLIVRQTQRRVDRLT
ncbi:MAG: hypothetical protein H6956_10560 [Chromatiaceae bacterium]|nr:hypothetical protein [Chromatiaceae bacterium]MCP5434905.1 hypothetical protein [Chromatiaceae bacterium]HOP15994.1 hypothetical protein [Gammaproteobacteria bacterium]